MAEAHQHRAEDHGALRPKQSVGEQPAEQRREIDQPGIPAIDQRGESLIGHRATQFEQMAQGGQANDMLGMAGKQQLLDHVEYEQPGHPIIGKPLPQLGAREDEQPARPLSLSLMRPRPWPEC